MPNAGVAPSAARREEIEAVFDDALDQPAAVRDAWLAARCGSDETLRAEVAALLAAHARTDGILDRMPRVSVGAASIDPVRDRLIGPYRVIRELGRGGMGVVYLAERADGEFRRRVAIKLLRDSPDADELHRRFLAERQILASLGHPNIAQLLDGGTTDGQLPYLVMEYVDGVAITAYCDRHRLDVAARLRLFMDVCDAVHAAHQNLIIHRDIKPGNVLVIESGQVKLLDFGIAKLVNDAAGTFDAPNTRPAFRVMTPEYASPEQVRGESITTASDVYALGVVLYELLAGRRPYEFRTYAPRELHEQVCERTHDPPSVAVARSERDDRSDRVEPEPNGSRRGDVDVQAIAAARGVSVDRLRRQLRGDLDAIVMMALRKEPRARYGSAELLREDIARYLDEMPVVAQRQSRAYHVRKFVARHRGAVAAGILAASSLAVGTGVAIRQATVASRERDRATAALARVEQTLEESEEMAGFLVGLFDVNALAPLGGLPRPMDDFLKRGALQVERSKSEPLVQARMLDGMGRVYRAVGRFPDARLALGRSLELRRANANGRSAEAATTMMHLADVLRMQGDYPAAESLSRAALSMRRDVLGRDHPSVADIIAQLAGLAVYRGALVEAESLARDALALRKATLPPDDPRIGTGLELLSATLRRRGERPEAEQRLEEAIALYERRFGADDLTLTTPLLRLAEYRSTERHRLNEAEPLLQRAVTIRERVLGSDHPQTAYALGSLAELRSAQGRHADAERLMRRAIDIHRQASGDENLAVAYGLGALTRIHLRAGQPAAAERTQREAVRLTEKVLGPRHSSFAGTLAGLAEVLLVLGRLDDASALYHRAIDVRRRALGGEIGVVGLHIAGLADVHARRKDFTAADSLYRRAIELLSANTITVHPEVRDVYRRLADLHGAHGRRDDAARYRELAEGGESVR
jgi:eukaryotic-like serine/threonine-protein kinase